jgi:hypothetical protein
MALLDVARVGTNRRRVVEPSQDDATHIEWHQRILLKVVHPEVPLGGSPLGPHAILF